jgi:hypothetical protein
MANRKTRKARRNGNLTRQNGTRRLLPKLNNGSQIVHDRMMGKTTPQEIARMNRNIRITYLVNPNMPSHIQKQVRNALNRFKATGSVYPN